MKVIGLLTKMIVVLILVFNLFGCEHKVNIFSQTTKKTLSNNIQDMENENVEKSAVYYDERFKFHVEYPNKWNYELVKFIEPTNQHNGTPDAGIKIYIDNNIENRIYIFGQISKISFGDSNNSEEFKTTSGLTGRIYTSTYNNIKQISISLDNGFLGAIVHSSNESFNENEKEIMNILKSIRK